MCYKIDLVAFLKVRHILEASGISTDPDSWASLKPQQQCFPLAWLGGQSVGFLTKSVASGKTQVWDFFLSPFGLGRRLLDMKESIYMR